MDPQQSAVASEFDQYKDSYKEAVNDAVAFSGFDVDFFTTVKADQLLATAGTVLGECRALRALDLGCGIGNYHVRLSGQLGELSGIDVSPSCIEVARARNPAVDYQVYDGDRLPYQDATFDLVFTICVMHHVPPKMWPRFTAEMYRVLRPGRLAMVFEHNPLNPFTRHVVNSCPFDRDAVLLWPRNLMGLFLDAGFSDVKTRSILTVPPRGKGLKLLDEHLGRLPFGAQYYLTAIRPQSCRGTR